MFGGGKSARTLVMQHALPFSQLPFSQLLFLNYLFPNYFFPTTFFLTTVFPTPSSQLFFSQLLFPNQWFPNYRFPNHCNFGFFPNVARTGHQSVLPPVSFLLSIGNTSIGNTSKFHILLAILEILDLPFIKFHISFKYSTKWRLHCRLQTLMC
jgi:hypothetical protein